MTLDALYIYLPTCKLFSEGSNESWYTYRFRYQTISPTPFLLSITLKGIAFGRFFIVILQNNFIQTDLVSYSEDVLTISR